MSNLNCVQLQSACRLCLSSDSDNVDIFGEEGRRQKYQDKIWKHFSLWVCIDDTLPKTICQLCCDRLEEYHSFFLKVEDVQRNIHKMVSSRNYNANYVTVSHIQPHYGRNPFDQSRDLPKKDVLNMNMNNSKFPRDVHSDEPDPCTETCKTPSQTFVFYNSCNVLSHLQEQCYVATDAESESTSVNELNVECIKVEEDPLQIKNDDINSDTETVQAFSGSINCESVPSELVSVQLFSDTNCDLLGDTSIVSASDSPSQTIQYRTKNRKNSSNLRKTCDVGSVSKDREGDAEEEADSASTKFESDIRNVTLSNKPGNHGNESQSESGCNISAEENDGWEESQSIVQSHSNELPLNIQLAEFYNYSCKICKPETAAFSSFFLLCKHYRLKHNTKGYVVCCGHKLFSKPLLVSHMVKHLHPGIYRCHECGKELANELTYEKHMIHHLPEDKRPFKCECCLRGFASKAELQSHERIHLPDEERLASVCDTCGKKFANHRSLISHQRYVHEKVREAMCHICPKTFPNRSALKEHLYSHVAKSEQKQCRDCGKWLKNDSTLRLHMKSHGSQLFRCPHCDKVYNFPQSLRDHLQSHSNIHPHECLVCGKAFKRKQGLKTHAVQHTGEKPYQCPHCARMFASSGNYYAHKKRMHVKERAGTIT